MIDLRSDTVTTPTPAMRRAMAEAEVGDDVYGEDPTVNRLQALLAEMAGFEGGLFVPSGSMSNLAAVAALASPGVEAIMPEGAHIYEHELGALCGVAGVVPRLVKAPRGVPEVADVEAAVRSDIHRAPSGLIALENTHNLAGGTVLPLERGREIIGLAEAHRLPTHLDGARAFNAAAALGVSIAEVCRGFDSVSISLSKGLGGPVGSVLLGSRAYLKRAHRYRKMLGGGMRQAGVIAAAGIVAVTEMPLRLKDDHDRARALAEGLAGLDGVSVDLGSVQTNMVYLQVNDAPALAAKMREKGVLVGLPGTGSIRLVTHHQITDEDLARALESLKEGLAAHVEARGGVRHDGDSR